jgi:small subunit ribosomal protein S1
VTILNFDKETQRISLGLKQSSKDPWGDVDKKYPLHSKAKGRVVNLLPYGAFVELERGIEGLVHVSEFSWTRRVNHPSEMLAVGDEIEVVVLSMDRESRKIALGIKQLELNPWLDATERYPVGSTCEGKIKNLTDYGAFVEIEPGLGGLIHISDMTWTKRVHHPSELLKKGDTVQAKVLAIDPAARKISLGMKQLEEDPWKERTLGLKIGSIITGKVSKVVNFGLFVELPNGLEGLVHASELPEARSGGFLGLYKIGDELRVKLLRIDEENRRISLGLRNKKISLLDKKGLSA